VDPGYDVRHNLQSDSRSAVLANFGMVSLPETYSYNNSGFWVRTLIMNQGDTVEMNA
jgi:hypothetical protein